MKPKNMTELLAQIERVWPFDSKNYNRIPEDSAEKLTFALAHVATHISISNGNLLTVLEPTQHGDPLTDSDRIILRREAMKMLFETLRLFALLKIPFQEIVEYVDDKEGRIAQNLRN